MAHFKQFQSPNNSELLITGLHQMKHYDDQETDQKVLKHVKSHRKTVPKVCRNEAIKSLIIENLAEIRESEFINENIVK